MTAQEEFTNAYLACALWASTDDDDEPLDKQFSESSIHPDSLAKMKADCLKFYTENRQYVQNGYEGSPQWSREEVAGSDFWLTRNGHGAGFWDGDWSDGGKELTDAAHSFGECDLYIGDDGLLHIFPL